MAITKGAKRAIRGADRKVVFNLRRFRAMRTAVKEVEKLDAKAGQEDMKKKLSDAYKAIDKATKRGIIKKNTASRKKSRLSARLKKVKSA